MLCVPLYTLIYNENGTIHVGLGGGWGEGVNIHESLFNIFRSFGVLFFVCLFVVVFFFVFFFFFFFFVCFCFACYICSKRFILVIRLKKSNIFIFPTEKTAAKYAKLDRVGNLYAGFRQVPLVQNFWKFHSIVIEHHLLKISQEKQKKKNVLRWKIQKI